MLPWRLKGSNLSPCSEKRILSYLTQLSSFISIYAFSRYLLSCEIFSCSIPLIHCTVVKSNMNVSLIGYPFELSWTSVEVNSVMSLSWVFRSGTSALHTRNRRMEVSSSRVNTSLDGSSITPDQNSWISPWIVCLRSLSANSFSYGDVFLVSISLNLTTLLW